MKRMSKLSALLACGLLLLLAGCVEVTARVEFNSSGGGKFSMELLEIQGLPFDMIKEQLLKEMKKSAAFQQGEGKGDVKVTEGARDNRKYLRVDGKFKDTTELRDYTGNVLQASFTKMPDGNCEARFERLPRENEQTPMTLTVVMPGRVLEANTGSISGNMVVWTKGNTPSLQIRSEAGSNLALVLAIAAVLAGVSVPVIILVFRARARRAAAEAAYMGAAYPPSRSSEPAPTYVQPGATCPQCGARLKNGATFCTKCGSRFEAQEEAVEEVEETYAQTEVLAGPPGPLLCSQCGAAVEPGDQFCGECGAAVR
ncbi:MAG TPA: zinc ribbon domain-containing protein [Candidatus Nitrosotenuis sp.]|nr:zinc ribbon domain-containing protein [Candidatus Nitrosotenuis sp.]